MPAADELGGHGAGQRSIAAFAEQYIDRYVPWVNAPALMTFTIAAVPLAAQMRDRVLDEEERTPQVHAVRRSPTPRA